MKKGQAALEFLMTYGWAILVVLVAIGALAYFGVLNPVAFVPNECVLATASGFYCQDYRVEEATENVVLKIKNIGGATVTVTGITLTNTGSAGTCTLQSFGTLPTTDYPMTAEDEQDATFLCDQDIADGEKFRGDIEISYYAEDINFPKTSSGKVVATAQ